MVSGHQNIRLSEFLDFKNLTTYISEFLEALKASIFLAFPLKTPQRIFRGKIRAIDFPTHREYSAFVGNRLPGVYASRRSQAWKTMHTFFRLHRVYCVSHKNEQKRIPVRFFAIFILCVCSRRVSQSIVVFLGSLTTSAPFCWSLPATSTELYLSDTVLFLGNLRLADRVIFSTILWTLTTRNFSASNEIE